MNKKIKQWILHTFFNEEVEEMYARSVIEGSKDAFEKAREDLEEMMVETDKDKIEARVEERLAEMLFGNSPKDIMTTNTQGHLFINGERADEVKVSNLKAEAEFFMTSELWKIIHDSINTSTQKDLFVSSQSIADIQRGKTILYTLSVQNNMIKLLNPDTPYTVLRK